MLRKLDRDSKRQNRLIVVSNRLPMSLTQEADEHWTAKPSSGGLVSAMMPVLRRQGGVWIGWPGTVDASREQVAPALEQAARETRCSFEPVMLTQEEVEGFYHGFSNEVIWPLFHDLFTNCNFDPSYWHCYERVNHKFAEAVANVYRPGDFIWVHDYHLMDIADALKRMGLQAKTGFFLHTPFPPLEIFLKLPWRFEILRSLLQFDSIGFQTLRDRRNFLQCVRALFKLHIDGAGSVVQLHVTNQDPEWSTLFDNETAVERDICVGSFPIGIDYQTLAELAEQEPTAAKAARLKDDLSGRQMILGVDRLDYTKGLPNKLQAFRNALERYPELRGRINLVQHVIPSRSDIPEYRQLKFELEHLVGEINGQFTESGWVPIHYMYHSLPFEDLVAYYRAADMALITSLKDGMNLVAKEYCAAQVDETGALILSEFAGAAAQLQKGALLVNPHDIEQVADGIYSAFKMPQLERRNRMRALRRTVRTQDVYRWADTFLTVTTNRDPVHVPYTEDYLPRAQ